MQACRRGGMELWLWRWSYGALEMRCRRARPLEVRCRRADVGYWYRALTHDDALERI